MGMKTMIGVNDVNKYERWPRICNTALYFRPVFV